MERIADVFSNNPRVALVCIVSLRDRAVVLREARPSLGPSPPDAVVSTYLNIITTAALAFEAEAPNAAGGMASPSRAGRRAEEELAKDEVWGLLRFRTRQWEISAFRQDDADVAFEAEAQQRAGGGGPGGAQQAPDHFMMVTFAEPSDELGTDSGNMASANVNAAAH